MGQSVSDSFRFGESYRIFELWEHVCSPSACSAQQRLLQDPCFRIDCKSVTLCMAFILENSPNSWQKIMRYFSLWQQSALITRENINHSDPLIKELFRTALAICVMFVRESIHVKKVAKLWTFSVESFGSPQNLR